MANEDTNRELGEIKQALKEIDKKLDEGRDNFKLVFQKIEEHSQSISGIKAVLGTISTIVVGTALSFVAWLGLK